MSHEICREARLPTVYQFQIEYKIIIAHIAFYSHDKRVIGRSANELKTSKIVDCAKKSGTKYKHNKNVSDKYILLSCLN